MAKAHDAARGHIAIVSAHYPPNFVSGGSLVPQLHANQLRQRGWTVDVLAGHYTPNTPEQSGQWWEDPEVGGLHWFNTTKWLGWADRHNYDNPPATEWVRTKLETIVPDVVHFHSMQGLGAGAIDAACDLGLPTVVTMHDFWWTCARQFLVDTNNRPCSVVTSCGDCACETGRAAADERRERLRATLARVDQLQAPSRSAAAVFAANGLDFDRLRIVENAVEVETDHGHRAGAIAKLSAVGVSEPHDRAVVVRYAGGPNPLKGSETLVEAASILERDLQLRYVIEAHGLDADLTPRLDRLKLLEPFDPADLQAVLAATDILVVPSIMRESHSILTREALSAGVVVVTSDSIGPEEVVRDGFNGAIVATGDAAALAEVLGRLVSDPAEVLRLGANAASITPVTIEAHLDELEASYEELLRLGHRTVDAVTAPKYVVFVVGIEGAPLRYRAHLHAEALNLVGVQTEVVHYRDPAVSMLVDGADLVIYYRVPATLQTQRQIGELRATGTPVLFDVDDLIFDPELIAQIPAMTQLPEDEAELWMEGVRRYRTTLEACDGFIASTPVLAEHAHEVSGLQSFVYPNGVGVELARISEQAAREPRAPGPLRIGYFSGTTTHDADWAMIEPAVVDAMVAHPDTELWVGGLLKTTPALEVVGDRVRRFEMAPWTELPDRLRDLDVNLAPLEQPSIFNEAKSSIKWLEAALVGTPTIASPTGPFRHDIDDGVDGFLATTPTEWATALDQMLSDDTLRAAVGRRAQRRALLEYSPHRQAQRSLEILTTVIDHVGEWRAEAAPSLWSPVANDEPPESHPLEAYPNPASAVEDPARREQSYTPQRSKVQRLVDRVNHAVPRSGWGQKVRTVAETVVRSSQRLAQKVRGRG